MKRSPSYSCSSSSSSSCGGPEILDQSNLQQSDQKPINKPKRTRRNRKINPAAEKCQNTNNKPNSSGHGRRSSIYRGVTRHRWTGRYEAHLWDKSSWNNIQNKKGRQVYLGAYDGEEAAAHTYDLAALKYWGPATTLNFPIDTYTKELEEMQKVSREEYLASLRRQSSGFSRGVSKYRGVARHHHNGRWEARIGRVFGNKYLYLGTYNTQEEAAAAYDIAAIEYRGANAVTNFDISNYIDTFKRKNLPLNLQQQPEQDPPPKCSINGPAEEEVKEHKVQQCQPQPQQQQQLKEEQMVMTPQLHEYPHLVPCIESTTMDVMDLGHNDHQNQFTWNFMDTAGFTTQLPVPDMSLDNKPFDQLPDLFDDMGFEANFDLIFGAAGGDANLNGLLDTTTAGSGVDEVGASRNLEDNGSSSYSSPSSTTTSVSYNYSV